MKKIWLPFCLFSSFFSSISREGDASNKHSDNQIKSHIQGDEIHRRITIPVFRYFKRPFPVTMNRFLAADFTLRGFVAGLFLYVLFNLIPKDFIGPDAAWWWMPTCIFTGISAVDEFLVNAPRLHQVDRDTASGLKDAGSRRTTPNRIRPFSIKINEAEEGEGIWNML